MYLNTLKLFTIVFLIVLFSPYVCIFPYGKEYCYIQTTASIDHIEVHNRCSDMISYHFSQDFNFSNKNTINSLINFENQACYKWVFLHFKYLITNDDITIVKINKLKFLINNFTDLLTYNKSFPIYYDRYHNSKIIKEKLDSQSFPVLFTYLILSVLTTLLLIHILLILYYKSTMFNDVKSKRFNDFDFSKEYLTEID